MNHPKTVLFIDNDEEDLLFFSEAVRLIDPSIQRYTATSCKDALRMLTFLVPDLIFLDHDMRQTDGKQCFLRLKKNEALKFVPIIICSNSEEEEDQREFNALGADFYLVKPDSLLDTINSFLYIFSTYPSKAELKAASLKSS